MFWTSAQSETSMIMDAAKLTKLSTVGGDPAGPENDIG